MSQIKSLKVRLKKRDKKVARWGTGGGAAGSSRREAVAAARLERSAAMIREIPLDDTHFSMPASHRIPAVLPGVRGENPSAGPRVPISATRRQRCRVAQEPEEAQVPPINPVIKTGV